MSDHTFAATAVLLAVRSWEASSSAFGSSSSVGAAGDPPCSEIGCESVDLTKGASGSGDDSEPESESASASESYDTGGGGMNVLRTGLV